MITGGGPGRPPFWRTLEESCKGLGSVTLKINTQHTRTKPESDSGREREICLLVLNLVTSTSDT